MVFAYSGNIARALVKPRVPSCAMQPICEKAVAKVQTFYLKEASCLGS